MSCIDTQMSRIKSSCMLFISLSYVVLMVIHVTQVDKFDYAKVRRLISVQRSLEPELSLGSKSED